MDDSTYPTRVHEIISQYGKGSLCNVAPGHGDSKSLNSVFSYSARKFNRYKVIYLGHQV